MSHELRDQFVRDMQVAGLSSGTQKRYLSSLNGFFRDTWLEPSSVRERDVQDLLIALRDQGRARETFRGYRYALQFFFVNTHWGVTGPSSKKTEGTRTEALAPGVAT